MARLRISVIQSCPPFGDLPGTLDKLELLVGRAAAEGASLVVFPEAFIGGYPKFSTFGASVGTRTDPGRTEFLHYYNGAISLAPSSPELARIRALASTHDVFLVGGVIERAGGTLYCTIISIDPNGEMRKRRKLMPTGTERVVWGMGDGKGEELEVWDREIGREGERVSARIGAAVCWENYMPLLRTHYYAQGIQLYCAPTVDARPAWQHTMHHIALEGRCFVLSSCQFAQQKHFPPTHPLPEGEKRDPEGVVIAGGSVIVGPLGDTLAGPLWGEEGILTADVDLEDCVRGKMDLDVTGHYARPDIFQLLVHGK